MKAVLFGSLAALAIALASCGEPAKEATPATNATSDTTAANTTAMLQGKWQSTEDAKSIIEISDKSISNIYDGKQVDSRTFEYSADCSGNACQGGSGAAGCYTSAGTADIECYSIVSISATDLQVSLVGATGKTLSYKKMDAAASSTNSPKFDEAMKTYYATLASMPIQDELLESIAHYLEPSIYDPKASMVNCGDKTEKERIKKDFMIGKLGCEPKGKNLETAIDKVCEKMSGMKEKHRAVFYYLLVVQEDMSSKFLN